MKSKPGGSSGVGAGELTVRQQHHVPEAVLALSPMTNRDYVDLFTLETPDASDWSAEQWARAAFEQVAGLGGQLIWRVLLNLRLRWRRSPNHIAGWKIADRGDSWLRIEAHSWMVTGHLVILVEEAQVSLATFVRYHRPAGARVWSWLSAKHRQAAPGLLRDTHRVHQPGSH